MFTEYLQFVIKKKQKQGVVGEEGEVEACWKKNYHFGSKTLKETNEGVLNSFFCKESPDWLIPLHWLLILLHLRALLPKKMVGGTRFGALEERNGWFIWFQPGPGVVKHSDLSRVWQVLRLTTRHLRWRQRRVMNERSFQGARAPVGLTFSK